MNKRITYDVGLKLTVANEYAEGGVTYATLAEKYNVPRPTIATWIQRNKRHGRVLTTQQQSPGFLDVTNTLHTIKQAAESITIVVNGLELKSDLNTLLLLLQGAKHVSSN